MSKADFLTELGKRLSGLPKADIEERLAFYSEMIDDRMEEGITEEEAVVRIGTVDEIAEQILSEIPLAKLIKERVRPQKTLRAWEIVLLVLGSPVWLSLLIAALSVALSVYIVLWAVVISLFAVCVSLAVATVAAVPVAVRYLLAGTPAGAVFMIGAALACAGLTILLFYLSCSAGKGVLKLTEKSVLGVKSLFVGKKEEVEYGNA